jgi:hypothetical protein
VCVRACVRACVHACVRACVRVRVRVRVRVSVSLLHCVELAANVEAVGPWCGCSRASEEDASNVRDVREPRLTLERDVELAPEERLIKMIDRVERVID